MIFLFLGEGRGYLPYTIYDISETWHLLLGGILSRTQKFGLKFVQDVFGGRVWSRC